MSCSAVYCTSRTTKGGHKNRELSFHVFPKYPEIRAEWLKAVRRDNWQPTKFSRLCSKHFDESCFVEGLSVKKLKPDAVPTIFEGYSTYYQLAVPKRKPSNRITEIDFSPKKRKRLLECGLDPRECNFYSFKLVAKLARVKKIALKRLKQIKKLREANRRLKKKNASLLNVISDLKKENLLNTEDISEKPHSRFTARFVSPLSRQQSRLRAPEERTYFLCLYSGLRKYLIETMVEELIMRKRRSEK